MFQEVHLQFQIMGHLIFLTSPIINQPNVAILSTESVKKAVVVESEENEDSIEIRHSGILSLTWDHRVFDGSTALLFLNAIKDKLENHDWSEKLVESFKHKMAWKPSICRGINTSKRAS